MPPSEARIFLVDDHPMIRDGLRHLIENETDWEVCGEASSAMDAMERIPSAYPDLVVMDLTLPDKSGLEVLKHLHVVCPGMPVLVLSMHDELLYAERVLRAGGRGYMFKGSSNDELLGAIAAVLDGSLYLSERVAETVITRLTPGRATSGISCLSDRELEIFALLGRGMGSVQISKDLHISSRTVDAHRTNIRVKLGLGDAAAVMREAIVWVEVGSFAAPDSDETIAAI